MTYGDWLAIWADPLGNSGCGEDARERDRDGSKIFDSLQQVLVTMGDKEQVPVLIMAHDQAHLTELEKVAGEIQIKRRYQVVPAVAASVTKDQVSLLSRQSFVRHIEYDEEVQICMDGANRWAGADKARLDFGVTGDRDGSPGYSSGDIVVAVIDTGVSPSRRTPCR